MTNNTAIWDRLGKTDPAHVKGFKRAGGFSGTAIKPMWSFRRMTEEFGACGKGWGINEPSFQTVPGVEGEVLVYCTVSVWHGQRENTVFGVGGDKAVTKNKYGLASDDEAFKKAFTDAITNALKLIGVGADVHMGLFDDSKYVNAMRDEFSAPRPRQEMQAAVRGDISEDEAGFIGSTYDFPGDMPALNQRPKSSAQLKREDAWGKITSELYKDLLDCHTLNGLSKLKDHYRERARAEGWNRTYTEQLKEIFETAEQDIGSEEAEAA